MKIFVILSRVPYPLEKGDKLRAFNQIRELSKRHEIYLCALNDVALHPDAKSVLEKYCKEIYIYSISKWSIIINVLRFFFQGKPLQCGYFYNAAIHKKILRLIATIQPDHIYSQLIRTAEYVKHCKVKKTIDYQDAFSKGAERIMEKSSFWKRIFFRMEMKRLQQYERDIFDYFDNRTMITKVDSLYINHPLAETITVVPNGVDFSVFSPIEKEKHFDLIFTGNFSYYPNIDAAIYFSQEIFPFIKEKHPTIRVAFCGANPSSKVLVLQNENIIVTGWVNDMKEYYAMSRIFMAPMRLGTGLQNKLLEAMAMRLPCVTSVLASAPLNSGEKKNMLICNSPLDYADSIDKLLLQPDFYQEIATNGYQFVRQNYKWEDTTSILENLITNNESDKT